MAQYGLEITLRPSRSLRLRLRAAIAMIKGGYWDSYEQVSDFLRLGHDPLLLEIKKLHGWELLEA